MIIFSEIVTETVTESVGANVELIGYRKLNARFCHNDSLFDLWVVLW